MKNLALLALLFVVVVLAVVTVTRHGSGAKPEEMATGHPSQSDQVDATLKRATDVRDALPPPPMLTMDQARQLAKNRARQHQEIATANANFRKAMAARYQGERTSPAWASDTEGRIASVMKELQQAGGVLPADLVVDCKATVCRIDASFPAESQADTWVSMLMPMLGGVLNKSVVSRQQVPGGIALVIYGSQN